MTDNPGAVTIPSRSSTTALDGHGGGRRAAGGGRHATLVAAGILLSRAAGLVRQRVLAFYLGSGAVAGVLSAALRIPNLLQNMLGEGALSSAFIPVYTRLLARGDRDEAEHVAGAAFGLLCAVTTVIVAGGIAGAPVLVALVTPGLVGDERLLAVHLVRILFPATGTLVLSAWCLGILNSHRRFFLSYAAPVASNVAVILALLVFGPRSSEDRLGTWVAAGYVAGAALQLGVQLPTVLRVIGRFRPTLSTASASVRTVLRNFLPALVGRGVVQLSAFLDTIFASYVGARALAVLGYQQTLYLLPISLFGMAISASELPAMSAVDGAPEEIAAHLRARVDAAARRLAFFVVPSAAAFLCLGDVVAGALLQTGRQTPGDTRYLWLVLMGSAVGLVPAAMGRLYSSAFYALRDTRTPLRYAVLRLLLTGGLAWWAATRMPGELGLPREAGLVGITATTAAAAWLEYSLLRRALARRVGRTGVATRHLAGLWGAAIGAGACGIGVKAILVHRFGAVASVARQWGGGFLPPPRVHAVAAALPILAAFGVTYLAAAAVLGRAAAPTTPRGG